jgi:ABC-2 type transport system ATP-binding protein
VGLAQALINDPDVLILDEPTSGLDPNQMSEIRQLILALGKNKTILLSSHIMQEVEAMCSRVIIINNGKIVADDSVEAIKQKLTSKNAVRIVKFRESINMSELESLEGVKEVVLEATNTYKVTGDGHTDLAEIVFNFAVAAKTIILEQQEQSESLEVVFQQLTKNA